MARTIAELLEEPERAARMGAAARTRAEELFSIERMVAETLALIDSLWNRRLAQPPGTTGRERRVRQRRPLV